MQAEAYRESVKLHICFTEAPFTLKREFKAQSQILSTMISQTNQNIGLGFTNKSFEFSTSLSNLHTW